MSDIAIRVESFSKRYRIDLFVLVLMFLLSITPRLFYVASINSASLTYWFETVRFARNEGERLPIPPTAHPRSLSWQAIRARNSGDWGTVISLMKPLADASDPYALQFMGYAYEAQGDYPAAINAWEQIGFVEGLLRVAEAAEGAAQPNVAYEAYLTAWEIDPRQATGELVSFYKKRGELLAAEEVLREALLNSTSLDRVRPYWYRTLAQLLMEQERWGEAAATWEQVIQNAHLFYPGAARLDEAYFEMAWAYHLNGNPALAISSIEQALVMNSTPRYYLRAGAIYEAAGETDKAVAAYRQVLLTDPENETVRNALERLVADD